MSPNNTITKYVSEKDRNLPEIPERVGETLIPISTNCCDEFDYKEINNKILHAFNELRILSQTN